MSSVIITVVVVLGIIVAGGFLLYFMGDLFMSLSHKKKDEDAINKKQAEETEELKKRIDALEKSDELKKDPEVATILYNGAVVENYNPNEDEQEVEEEPEEQIEEPETVEEEAEEPAQEEEPAEETEEEDDTADFIKQRRQELMERLARMQNAQEEEEEEPEEEETVDLTEEQPEETTEQDTEETNVEEQPAVPATTEETFEQAKTDVNALANAMTLEELESKLAEEQDRLKANEKELRQCKKEFIPLRRIKRTLESDKKKLQRKEALVAKQKTVLYGVNNYADLDEEKAKKLAEDLDLYDGLKLSVQHCEEVMEKNEDRYPLLEKIFNLLTTQNAEIKEDIKNLQEAIDSLKADDTTDETADAE